jgi:hypothetical protein
MKLIHLWGKISEIPRNPLNKIESSIIHTLLTTKEANVVVI